MKIITINQTVDYMARGFVSFMRGVDITRAIGRVGLKVEPVLGPNPLYLPTRPPESTLLLEAAAWPRREAVCRGSRRLSMDT